MKILHLSIVGGIFCIVFGVSVILIAVADDQYRIYVYRYVDSGCKPGSSCPFIGVNDNLIWSGITLVIIGSFLLSYRRAKHGMNFKK